MRASAVAGVIFANVNDKLLNKLTADRSMASVPFGARYRLIDFSLSNLVNAGISNVGIITKENYHSLMDHLGSGVSWDLDRKNGGLCLLPPYGTSGARRYNGTVDALYGARNYIDRSMADYIVICNSDTVANIDISSAIKKHISDEADVSLIYHHGRLPKNNGDTMVLAFDKNKRVNLISFEAEEGAEIDFAIGIIIIQRELLLNLINEAFEDGFVSFNRDVLAAKIDELRIFGYEHGEYVAIMDDSATYYKASMDLLDSNVRKQLFNSERPVFTKTGDNMPTRYGTKSSVKNACIADGCVIKGTVKNSILFRGVTVEKDAVVENCILMQGTIINEGSQLNEVVADKNVVVNEKMVLKGTADNYLFIKKNQIL